MQDGGARMTKSKMFIMKGISCSGKSTYAEQLARKENAVIISSDKIGALLGFENKPNPPEVFRLMERLTLQHLEKHHHIIIDATNLTRRKTNPWIRLAKRMGAETICVFVNIDDIQLEKQMEQRIQTRWTHMSMKELKGLTFRMKVSLQTPTLCDGFDDIILVQNQEIRPQWSSYFQEHQEQFLSSPSKFMWDFYQSGKMEEVMPELVRCIGYKQENTHHNLTVFKHMMKAADHVEVKTPEFVWAMCLHDIGKVYPGIKSLIARFKEDYYSFKRGVPYRLEMRNEKYFIQGKEVPKRLIITDKQYHYYNHDNLSAQIAYRILERMGYSKPFIIKVCSYIQHHMRLPYGQEPSPKLVKNLHPIYEDLLVVRNADLKGK